MSNPARRSGRWSVVAVIATAVLLTACGPSVSPRPVAPKAATVDLVQMWDSATPCPDNPDAKLPTRPGGGELERQFAVTESAVLQDLRAIHAPGKSESAARENVAKLKTGLRWLWAVLDESQGRYDRAPSTREDALRAMSADHADFQAGRHDIEAALRDGKSTSVAVGSSFDLVCDRDRN
ncbi:hypothetical protein [Mycolicibacter acidiphilus]|uniref:hypothetical protein n=1 Tax=Mycolicibacter acidiphilus TaxID=2835306 RepID=UPI001BD6BBCF|nr:hypothetical protein [Mycolicibacter acidiphilus]